MLCKGVVGGDMGREGRVGEMARGRQPLDSVSEGRTARERTGIGLDGTGRETVSSINLGRWKMCGEKRGAALSSLNGDRQSKAVPALGFWFLAKQPPC